MPMTESWAGGRPPVLDIYADHEEVLQALIDVAPVLYAVIMHRVPAAKLQQFLDERGIRGILTGQERALGMKTPLAALRADIDSGRVPPAIFSSPSQ